MARIDELMEEMYEGIMNSSLPEETKITFAAAWLCGKMDAAERHDSAAKEQK